MATYTQHYNLAKPAPTDLVDVTVLNDNADKIDTALHGKQGTLTFDSSPTENSTNPVTSGGVYTANHGVVDTIKTLLADSSNNGKLLMISDGAIVAVDPNSL